MNLLTKQQVAQKLQVSIRTVDRLICKYNVPKCKVGRQIRIPESSLQLLVEQDSMSPEEFQRTINNLYGDLNGNNKRN